MPQDTIETIVDFAIPDKEERDLRWELRSRLCAFREEAVAEARREQNAMFARHIDEIIKVTTNSHELADWLAFYRNTLTPPTN